MHFYHVITHKHTKSGDPRNFNLSRRISSTRIRRWHPPCRQSFTLLLLKRHIRFPLHHSRRDRSLSNHAASVLFLSSVFIFLACVFSGARHAIHGTACVSATSHVLGDSCCSVLQCVAACCSVLQCVAVCCSVLQCVAVCCSVLQCVAELHHMCFVICCVGGVTPSRKRHCYHAIDFE